MPSKAGVQKGDKGQKSKDCRAVVGIDLTLTSTGLAFYWPHDDSVTKLALVKTDPKKWPSMVERQRFIVRQVMQLIAGHCGVRTPSQWCKKIERVFMEGYSYNQAVTRLADLAEIGGLVKQAVFSKMEKPIVIVAPKTLKKFVMGRGDAAKNQMLLAAYMKYKRQFSSDDICDAYGLARLGGVIFYPPPDGLYRYEQECVETVKASNNL